MGLLEHVCAALEGHHRFSNPISVYLVHDNKVGPKIKSVLVLVIDSTTKGILCGLTINEMEIDSNQVAIHIDKVDSTAFLSSNSLIPSIVIDSCISFYLEHFLKYKSIVSFHVFASKKPEFIFEKSSCHPDKKTLSDRDLVSWWEKRFIKSINNISKLEPKVDLVCCTKFIPSEFNQNLIGKSIKLSSQNANLNTNNQIWINGLWDKETFGIKGECKKPNKNIPKFLDDPRSKILSKNKNLSSEEFYNLMSIDHDNSLSFCCYLSFTIKIRENSVTAKDIKNKSFNRDFIYEKVNAILSTSSFANDDLIKSSSKTILNIIRNVDHKDLILPNSDLTITKNNDIKPITNIINTVNIKRSINTDNDKPKVNVITQLVRKKPKLN